MATNVQVDVRRARARRGGPIEIGREKSGKPRAGVEAHLGGDIPRQHCSAIKCARAGAHERVSAELIERCIECIGPDSEFWIVGEVRFSERVTIVSAGCVRASGHSNAVNIGAYKYGLRHHPATGSLVILRDRIAIVAGFAWASEARPE